MVRIRATHRGFTLIELVMVMVILGIIAMTLAPVINQNVTAFTDTRSRTELTAKGRLALQRLARELRHTVPYSIELLSPTRIQFVTTPAGGRYITKTGSTPKISNATCAKDGERFFAGANLTALCVLFPTALTLPTNGALVIGNTSPANLNAMNNPGSWITLNAAAQPDAATHPALWKLTFTGGHTFAVDSSYKHYSIADFSHEVVLVGNQILWRRVNGIADPTAGGGAVLVDGVTGLTFGDAASLASGLLSISITITDGTESVTVQEEIYVRNSP
ncbi:MAG: type II secretion system GspH family protein [Gammaproteobacteria bacterium]|nr:type II secretion system GspH family protein [Gammaproteobacteria bacterium]